MTARRTEPVSRAIGDGRFPAVRGGGRPGRTLALLLTAALGLAAGQTPGEVRADPGATAVGPEEGGFLYVPNQGDATVSVVDTETNEVVRTVDLREFGFPPDAKPHHVVAEPDGSGWYLSLIGANAVLKFDAENRLLGQAGFEAPGMMALDPEREVLYVGRSMKAVNPPQRIGRIDTRDMSVEEIEVLFPRPHAIAIGPEGDRVHTASLSVNQIAALPAGAASVELIRVEGPVHVFVQFAVSPDGSRMVATGQVSGRLLVFDRTRPDELPLLHTVTVGAQPWHPVYTPDGKYVIFGNKGEDTVTMVDAESWEVAAVIEGEGLSEPHGAAMAPDGRHVYVSNNNLEGTWAPEGWSPPEDGEAGGAGASPPGSVVVVDLEARSVVKVIPVGANPNGLGLRPKR